MLSYVKDRLSSTSTGRLVVLIALLGALWIFILGIKSDIHLGDEPTHYMLASSIYETKERPLYYSYIHVSPETRGKPVGSEVLWHSLLASLWWIWGGKSIVIAQLYQAGWYILLVLTTYLLGTTLYDERIGLYSGLLAATMPAIAAYSILLYTDIALVALCSTCFLLLLKKRYFLAGLTLGLMILTKRNAYLMIPALLFCLFLQRDTDSLKTSGGFSPLCSSKKEWAKRLLVFITPALLINIPDLYFRYSFLKSSFFVSNTLPYGYYSPVPITFVHPESFVYYPSNLVKYPGIILYMCIGLYIFRRQYRVQDTVPIVAIMSYCILLPLGVVTVYFVTTFINQSTHDLGCINSCINSTLLNFYNLINVNFSMRYIAPILPMAAILACKGLVTVERKSVVHIVFALCILQMLISTLYVYQARKLSPLLTEAYNYIRLNTPPESSFLSPCADLSLYTNRTVMWNSDNTMPDLPYLFWNANSKEAMDILKKYRIMHIFIPKSMLWDDSQVKNIGMYPKSFVNKIPSFSFLERIFYNEDVSIWAVRPPLVKKE